MGFEFINEEQKIRISLSNRAYTTMLEDMSVFDVKTPSVFINTLLNNFKDSSIASVSAYLESKRTKYFNDFEELKDDSFSMDDVIKRLMEIEHKQISEKLFSYMSKKDISKLYHITNANIDFLRYDFEDEKFYNDKPGLYIKCLIEEYASFPFIERERIYRKDVYEIVESACKNNLLMYVRIPIYNQRRTLIIYPYKILPDTLNTQDYLACYTRFKEEAPGEKLTASFSMARLPVPSLLRQKSFLSKSDIKKMEEDIQNLSVSFLRGESTEIHIRLTDAGKRTFHNKLYSRPAKNEALSTEDEYVFFCSENQAFHYFYSFGPDAEIISPLSLRERMIKSHMDAISKYSSQ